MILRVAGLAVAVVLAAGCRASPVDVPEAEAGAQPVAAARGVAAPPLAGVGPGAGAIAGLVSEEPGPCAARLWLARAARQRTARNTVATIRGSRVCGVTFDGIPAYGANNSCASPGTGDVYTDRSGVATASAPRGGPWRRTEGGFGFQCVELATRYFYAKHNVDPVWSVATASQMCATHPGSVSVVSAPRAGDLMVFLPGRCGIGAAGHVAVVDRVQGGQIAVTQQNIAKNMSWSSSCAKCYLRAR